MNLNIDRSKWTKVRLGDVATAPSIRINNPSESGFERFIGNANIGQWDFRLTSWEPTSSVTSAMKGFETGDYLFVRRSLYASDFRERSPRATFDGVCSGDIITIRENPEHIADGFLIGVLNSPAIWKFVVANASGSITRRIKWRDLANYEFLLPPKDQQAKLAELLWAADAVIESECNTLSNCRTAFRSVEIESFGHSGKTKEKFLDIAKVSRGKFSHRPRNEPRFYGGDIPFIQTSEVVEAQKYITQHSQTLNEDGLKISKMFPKGTIVMTIAANIGYVGILDFDSAFTDSLVGVQASDEKIKQEYLFYYLNYHQPVLDRMAPESAQKNLSIDTMSAFNVYYPTSKNEQEAVVEKLDRILESINTVEEKISSSKLLQKSLINEIFSQPA